jgi:AcrR family transcriptional regulator
MPAPQRRRTGAAPRPRKADVKRQLLAAAVRLFAAHGYQAATPARIAEAAGVSEATLARHFDGKAAVLGEVLQQLRAVTLDRWRAEAAKVPEPAARLHALVDLYLAATREHAPTFRALHRALVEADEEALAGLRAFYVDCEAFLAGVIAEGQQAGVFRRTLDPRVGAWELIRSALGYTLTVPLAVPLYAEPDHLARAVDCVMQCLLKTDV